VQKEKLLAQKAAGEEKKLTGKPNFAKLSQEMMQ